MCEHVCFCNGLAVKCFHQYKQTEHKSITLELEYMQFFFNRRNFNTFIPFKNQGQKVKAPVNVAEALGLSMEITLYKDLWYKL